MAQITVCRLDELTDGEIRKMDAGHGSIAVVRNNGQIYAVQNRCSHKGAPISDGTVSTARNEIICPWHRFRFELATGRCATNPDVAIRTFPVQIVDNKIIVSMPG